MYSIFDLSVFWSQKHISFFVFLDYLKKHHILIFSEVIRKWAEPPRRRIGPFTTSKMEDTYIRDLTIRLGYPYVYVHQVTILIAMVIYVLNI